MSGLFRPEATEGAPQDIGTAINDSLPYSTTITVATAVLIASLCIFCAAVPLPERAEARGYIVPTGGLFRVRGGREALVSKIQVAQGQEIRAGQTVATLHILNDVPDENRRQDIAALRLERDARISAGQAEIDRLRLQVDEEHRRQTSLSDEAQSFESSAANARARTALAEDSLHRDEQLVSRGLVMPAWLDAAKDKLLASRQSQSDTAGRAIVARRDLATSKSAERQLRDQLRKAEMQAAELEASTSRELLTAKGLDAYGVVSPTDGKIAAVLTEEGASISADTPIAVVVPHGTGMVVEVYLASTSAGYVRRGDPAKVQVDAFPFRAFGTVRGTVASVSQAAVESLDIYRRAGEGIGPAFLARVALERPYPFKDGKEINLQPGMSVKVEITTGKKTIADRLFSHLLR